MSWIEKLHRAKAELVERDADPFRARMETAVRGMEAISTANLLDLLGLPNTTGNARRISGSMRSLGFTPIKTRRLMPGGFRDTVSRGWTRPVRESGCQTRSKKGDKVERSPVTVALTSAQGMEASHVQ